MSKRKMQPELCTGHASGRVDVISAYTSDGDRPVRPAKQSSTTKTPSPPYDAIIPFGQHGGHEAALVEPFALCVDAVSVDA